MNRKKLNKILAIMLVFAIINSYFVVIADYIGKSYATSINYEEQETSVKKTDVIFDAYFKEGDKGTHTYVSTSENEELKLYLKVKVDKGYLKNATINIEDSNFKVCDSDKLDDAVEEINEKSNTIVLNQINKGADKEIEIPIKFVENESYNLGNFAKDTNIKIKGTFVNDNAKEIEVNKDIVVNLALTEEANVYLSSKVINNGIFEKDGEKKRLVQIEVESKVEENKLPIRESNIEVKVPILGGKTPEYTSVIAKTTEGTNGKTGENFGKENYTIENGIIKIKVENTADENNNIEWKKNVTDKYIINLVYKQEEVEEIEEEVTSKLSLYNNEEKVLEGSYKNTEKLPEDSGKVILTEVESKEAISKGYMLVEGAKDTEYKEEIKLNVGYSSVVNNIKISKTEENYEDENGKKYEAKIYYKKIEISKENLEKVLGEEGTISIMKGDTKLGEINKDNTKYEITEDLTNIEIETSKVKAEGILNIEVTKSIKSREYSTETIEGLKKIQTGIKIETEKTKEEIKKEIKLENPTYKIGTEINPKTISTVIENENVEIKAILKSNDETERLYKNPIVEIELPSYIEKVKVNSVTLFYDDEIKPSKAEIKASAEGNKVLRLEMEGEQTKFNTNESVEGLTLVANLNIKTKEATPSTIENVKVTAINEGQEVAEVEGKIRYIAPTGMITLNGMSNYNENEDKTTSISGETETGRLDKNTKSKIATETITIMNNYNYTCGDIKILGRTPAEGNKDMTTGKVLGSTFTAKMVEGIKAVSGIDESKITVYYSTNSEATEDITKESNGWKKEVEDLGAVKSYLIIVEGTMSTGDVMKFEYKVEIPEGLEKEESTYSMFKVFYTNMDGVTKGQQETSTSTKVGASTSANDELKLTLEASVKNGEQVKEGKIIKYTVHITNTSTNTIKNAELKIKIPDIAYYTEEVYYSDTESYGYETNSEMKEYKEDIEEVKPNQTIDKTFYLKVASIPNYTFEEFISGNSGEEEIKAEDYIKREDYKSDEEYQKAIEMFNKILQEEQSKEKDELDEATKEELRKQYEKLTASEFEVYAEVIAKVDEKEETYSSNTIKSTRVQGNFELTLTSNEKLITIESGNTITYYLNIEKRNGSDYNNVVVNCDIPKGITFEDSNYDDGITMSRKKNKITWKIDKLTENKNISLSCKIDNLTTNINDVKVKMTATADNINENIESNEIEIFMGKAELKTMHTSNNKVGSLYEEDEIEYTYTIENTSNVNAYNINIKDVMSDGIILKEFAYKIDGQDEITTTEKEISITLAGKQKVEITVRGVAGYIDEDKSDMKISNYFEMTYDNKTITSDKIEHTVNKKIYDIDDNNNPIENYTISGLAWVDSNQDGIRDNSETLLKGIRVILIDESGNVISSTYTGENGEYIFRSVPKGKYVVAFVYDKMNYDVTKYNASENNASKVLDMKIKIDGIETECAATNTIELGSNLYDINIGLSESKKFDLSLTKTITKITTKTASNTNSKEYNNSKLEKIEIKSKDLKDTIVAVEYTITVTNNGAIAGYANRIVDYLSTTDLKFNSEMNSDWYLGTDGNLYNSSLKDKILNPGESTSVKLVLTKNMSETNTGLTNNTAEIYEAYNDEGVSDINSTPGNKVQDENDYGMAEIIIAVKTGVTYYIGAVIMMITIMAVVVYIVKKKAIDI